MSNRSAMHTDLRLAHSLFDVNIGDCEVGTRLNGRPAELARDHHAFDGPRGVPQRARDLERCAREVALKGVLIEENSAMELGGNVKVLRQRVVVDEPGSPPGRK